MKENYSYFFQVQHKMMVTNTSYCDFYVYKKGKDSEDKFMVRVLKNLSFCERLKEKLLNIFEEVILPEIVSRKNDPALENNQQLYCYCKRPSFPPMIACDTNNCEIEWFHYGCVNITRAASKNGIVLHADN